MDLDIVDYLKYPLIFWMILKVCVVISFGNQTKATPSSLSSFCSCKITVTAWRNIVYLGSNHCPEGVKLWTSSIQLVSLLISEGMSSFLFPWLNSKIDFLILEQESSAHSQTKNATFPIGISADFSFLKTQNQTQNLTEKKCI